MKHKRLHISLPVFLLTILLAWGTATSAAPLSRLQALERARQAMSLQGINLEGTARLATKATAHQGTDAGDAYYVFSDGNHCVIAAGDDRLPPVLGYTDDGSMPADGMPPALIDMLSDYARAGQSTIRPGYTDVFMRIAPLLHSKWGQGAPFNLMLPEIDGKHAAAGSTAIAMAQVMNFYSCPLVMNNDLPAYLSATHLIEVPELHWDQFPIWTEFVPVYSYDDMSRSAAMAARLTTFCVQALQTDLDVTGSRASIADLARVMPEYFEYAPSARMLRRDYYTSDEWRQLIIDELSNRHPVIYRAQSANGEGHTFIIDGLNTSGLFHVNWGWNGQCDGYYALNDLYLDTPGTCENGVATSLGCDAAMVVGIRPYDPDVENYTSGDLSFYQLQLDRTRYDRSGPDEAFTGVTVTGRFTNGTPDIDAFDLGMALYDGQGQLVATVFDTWKSLIIPGYGATHAWPVTIGPDVPGGTYAMRPVSRIHGTAKWKLCNGAMSQWVQAVVTDTTLTLTPMGNAAPASLAVNSLSLGDLLTTGHEITASVNITNTGMRPFSYVALMVDSTKACVAQVEIEPGDTGDITMHFMAPDAGTHTLALTIGNSTCDTIHTSQFDIAPGDDATITASHFKAKDVKPGQLINSGTLECTVNVTNQGDSTYDDYIVARAYRRTGDDDATLHSTCRRRVNLAPNHTTSLSFSFNHLTGMDEYRVTVAHYSHGKLRDIIDSPFYTMIGDCPAGDVNGDRTVDVSDLNLCIDIVLDRIASETFDNRADANEDGTVDITDVNLIINLILKRE